jgi:PPP family 3-phenylpropionic acid transporter
VYYAFSALSWKAMGLSGAVIGALWALGVVAEIVLFAFNRRLPGPLPLLVFGAAGAAIRWVAMAFDPPALLLPALQCLHALSFGASHLGAVQFLARAAPEGLGATAQGSLSVALGVVMAAALGLSGTLYDMLGTLAYLVMVAAASAGGLFVLAARRRSSDIAQRDA